MHSTTSLFRYPYSKSGIHDHRVTVREIVIQGFEVVNI
jgi:hypothetical protein